MGRREIRVTLEIRVCHGIQEDGTLNKFGGTLVVIFGPIVVVMGSGPFCPGPIGPIGRIGPIAPLGTQAFI